MEGRDADRLVMLVMHALSQPARSKLWQTSAQRALTASDHTDQSSWSATPSVLSAKKWPMSRNSGFLTLYTINQLLRTQSWCLYEGYSSPDTSGEIKTNHSHFTNSSKIIKPLHVYTKTYLYEENRKKKKPAVFSKTKWNFRTKVVLFYFFLIALLSALVETADSPSLGRSILLWLE